jgi:hypothetical protein
MAGGVAEEESADPVQNPAVVALEEHRTLKRVRLSQTTQYRSTEYVFNTTNIVERLLFSRTDGVIGVCPITHFLIYPYIHGI